MTGDTHSLPREKTGLNIQLLILFLVASSLLVYFLSSKFDLLERFQDYSRRHENWELDEILAVCVYLAISLFFLSIRQLRISRAHESEISMKNMELSRALSEIKQLRGIIPICASCKKIRDDIGLWQHVEAYISAHTEALFSHSLCPECMEKIYPGS